MFFKSRADGKAWFKNRDDGKGYYGDVWNNEWASHHTWQERNRYDALHKPLVTPAQTGDNRIAIAMNLRQLYSAGFGRDQALAIALGTVYGFSDGRRRDVGGESIGGDDDTTWTW